MSGHVGGYLITVQVWLYGRETIAIRRKKYTLTIYHDIYEVKYDLLIHKLYTKMYYNTLKKIK